MAFCNPLRRFRPHRPLLSTFGRALAFALPTFVCFMTAPTPASAQSLSIIRDTEIERLLYSYERPLLEAAGVDPSSVKMYINNDPSFNAFAAQSPVASESEDIFINTGLLLQLKAPNEVIGVLAHETGHIAGGDVIHSSMAMQKAMIPMLIGMAVGVAAMIAGAGNAGMGAIMMGQTAARAQFFEFSRAQESTADQRAITYLNRTHQSGEGMLHAFERLANENAMSAYYDKSFASDHPADRERIDALQSRVNESPWKDKPDSPAAIYEYHMVQAKLIGYLSDPEAVLRRFPESDNSDPALYARAMAYLRQPNLNKALAEINILIQRHPEESLLPGNAGPDLCRDEPAAKRHRALPEGRRPSARRPLDPRRPGVSATCDARQRAEHGHTRPGPGDGQTGAWQPEGRAPAGKRQHFRLVRGRECL